MEWMIMPLKRYADFNGRSRRKEYWMFTLGVILAFVIAFIVFAFVFGAGSSSSTPDDVASMVGSTGVIVFGLAYLAILIPSIAVQVRRFHDQDKSGWFVLLALIPYIGGLILLVFMCLEGTRGPNRFGPDPKNPGGDLGEVFS
jgi:uncharacterized membrane protein YhaH (DUF805 family)